MKYKRKNRIKFDKKLDFSTGNFFNKKNIMIAGAILVLLALFYFLPKISHRENFDMNGGETIIKNQNEEIVEEIFMEDLDVKVKKIDLEKNYGIKGKKSIELDINSSEMPEKEEVYEEIFKKERTSEKGINTYKNDLVIYEYLKADEEKE